ncbi:RDD family protein [Cytobacillus sp. FJAT-54145]|uniref:RDD family protein n=1 Tax=Cytobacillus spartinae TaxID=3299023 RepID=A0ABW6KH06_9BACI
MESNFEHEHIQERVEYGGFWIRFAAYLIDSIIIGIPLAILSFVVFILFFGASGAFDAYMSDPAYLETLSEEEAMAYLFSYLGAMFVSATLNLIIALVYFAGFHSSRWQATIGKKLLKLKVIDTKGNRISFWRGLGRYAAQTFLSAILLIGYIIAAFTEKKQALHDLIAGTVVVKHD